MKLTGLQKTIIFVPGLLIIAAFFVNVLLTTQATPQNSKRLIGHFKRLVKKTYKRDYSFDLYFAESDLPYQISADFAHCLREQLFLHDVKPGQTVELYLHKTGIFQTDEVVAVNSGGQDYLTMDCVNYQVSDDRFKMPLMALILGLVLVGINLLQIRAKKPSNL